MPSHKARVTMRQRSKINRAVHDFTNLSMLARHAGNLPAAESLDRAVSALKDASDALDRELEGKR